MAKQPLVILVQGNRPGAGKDTFYAMASNFLRRRKMESANLKFATPLKLGTHASYGLDIGVYHAEYFQEVKDQPRKEFFGLTPRQAYIEQSENGMKPRHGKDVYGHLFVRSWETGDKKNVYCPGNGLLVARDISAIIVTDCGFVDEVKVVVKHFGAENCLGITIHRDGTAANDSRRLFDWHDAGVEVSFQIENNGTFEEFNNKITQTLAQVIP